MTGRPYNTQSFVSDSIVGGRLREKEGAALGIEKQGETKRSGSVVWRGQGWIKGLGADLRPLSVRQSWLHLTSLWRPPKPTGISCYTGTMPYGDSVSLQALLLSLCVHLHPSTWDNITGESGWEGLMCICASPQPVRDPPQRELSPLSGCPAAKSYLTLEHSHGFSSFPVLAPLGQPQHEGSQNREELSVTHLGMVNPSYVGNKGELSGPLLYCLVGETKNFLP